MTTTLSTPRASLDTVQLPTTASPAAVSRVDVAPDIPIRVSARERGELIVEHADGQVAARVVWADGKARVVLERADLTIEDAGDVSVRCRNFVVDAEHDVQLTAQREFSVRAVTKARLQAEVVEAVATLGDVVLRANDFVRACGERILLNTDKDPAESDRRARAFLQRLLGK